MVAICATPRPAEPSQGQAARTFAVAKSGCIVTATGAHFPLHVTLSQYLALCLNTVCGRWVRAGEVHAQPHVLLPEVAIRAQPYAPYTPWDYSETSRINGLPKTVVGAPTATFPGEILTPGPWQVRTLICSGSNPAVSLPDQNRAGRARSVGGHRCRDVEHRADGRLCDPRSQVAGNARLHAVHRIDELSRG